MAVHFTAEGGIALCGCDQRRVVSPQSRRGGGPWVGGRVNGELGPMTFFVVWTCAFYLTALAYVYDARGQSAEAVALARLSWIAGCWWVKVLVSVCFSGARVYYPYLSGGRMTAQVEGVEQSLLGGIHVGGDASGAGSAALGLVEQDGFLDAGKGAEQFADAHVEPRCGGVAAHEVGDLEGEDAVEGVHVDLLLGPVKHR